VGKLLCKISTGKPRRSVPSTWPACRPEFHYFVVRCCDPDPARRYADAGAALDAFDAFTNTDGDPEQTAKVLIASATEAIGGRDDAGAALAALSAPLIHHADDGDMFREIVPRLSSRVVQALLTVDAAAFTTILESSTGHVELSLDFAYCDIVAASTGRCGG
jgi:hypothetical protein